jgi:hypothetical protein
MALQVMTDEGGLYYKMLEKQSNTLNGIIKQFKSFKLATAEAIGLGINDSLKALLKYILEIGRAGQESFVNVFVKAIKEVIHWIWQIIIMWEVLGFRIAGMGDALAPVKKFFSDLRDAAGDVLTGIMILAVEVGKLFVAAFKPVQAFASPIIKELGAIVKDVLTAIADFIRPLIPMVKGSAGFFGGLGTAIAAIIKPALGAAIAIKGINTAINGIKTAKSIIGNVASAFDMLKGAQKAIQMGGIKGMALIWEAERGNKIAASVIKVRDAFSKGWDITKRIAEMVKYGVVTAAATVKSVALAAAEKAKAIATLIAAKAQAVFNAIASAPHRADYRRCRCFDCDRGFAHKKLGQDRGRIFQGR